MKIYTKTGDDGQTSYIGGRISKAALIIELVGSLDETNAALGRAIASLVCNSVPESGTKKSKKPKLFGTEVHNTLLAAQATLFEAGAVVANPVRFSKADSDLAQVKTHFAEQTAALETAMDTMDGQLHPLQNFILPGGSIPSADLHIARSVCRRAERVCVSLVNELELRPGSSLEYLQALRATQQYLNRLSDWMFVAARFINHQLGISEEIWSGTKQMPLGL